MKVLFSLQDHYQEHLKGQLILYYCIVIASLGI